MDSYTSGAAGFSNGAARSAGAPRFYVHGAGRAGREAWPEQQDAGDVFADHSACEAMAAKADAVSAQCPSAEVVVVAHSLGAVPVALAHRAGTLTTSHVVLVEPALYDVARGDAAVERHVGAMTEARGHAGSGDLFGFWEIVAPMMFGRPATQEAWEEDRAMAERFAAMDPPWGHGIGASVLADVPTLVVTGSWNDEYEAIAERLARAGARHVRLPGAKHRPQDLPGFEAVVAEFTSTAE